MDEIIKKKKQLLDQERWKQHIIDCQASSFTVQDYCQQQGLCKSIVDASYGCVVGDATITASHIQGCANAFLQLVQFIEQYGVHAGQGKAPQCLHWNSAWVKYLGR